MKTWRSREPSNTADLVAVENERWFLGTLHTDLPNNPATLLLGMYPKGSKQLFTQKLVHEMFVTAACTIIKGWTQPKCPSNNEWMNKMWYIHTMEYYSAIKMNKLIYTTVWIHLKKQTLC